MSLDRAIELATKRHAGQRRKWKIKGVALPYIFHPLDVMRRLWSWGIVDTDVLIAAVCHDLVEDTNATYYEIEEAFGRQATVYVEELTFLGEGKKEKEAYIATFKKKTTSVGALVIKIADRLCNVEDFQVPSPDYAPKYFHKAAALWEALDERQDEIKERFGQESYDALYKDFRKFWEGCLRCPL